MNLKELTRPLLEIVQHAWGYDNKTDPGFRTHFCTHTDDEQMLWLVANGFFVGPQHEGSVGHGCGMYYLTDEAIKLLKEMKETEKLELKRIKQEKKDARDDARAKKDDFRSGSPTTGS